MPRKMKAAVVGVSDHAGWAVLMTVAPGGTLLDRRRVLLLDDDLPKLPFHHECQALPLPQAEKLISRVQASAQRHSSACLEALARDTAKPIAGIAMRACPDLPESIAERISNYRAQCVADSVMYRVALAEAAVARGWAVHWYDARSVFGDAARALGRESIDDLLAATRAAIGPPWQKDQRMAMAAAIAAC